MASKKKAIKKEGKTLFLAIDDDEQVRGVYTKESEAIDMCTELLDDSLDPYVVEVEVKSVKEVLNKPMVETRAIGAINWDNVTIY